MIFNEKNINVKFNFKNWIGIVEFLLFLIGIYGLMLKSWFLNVLIIRSKGKWYYVVKWVKFKDWNCLLVFIFYL